MEQAIENIRKMDVYFEKIVVLGYLANNLDSRTKDVLKINENIDLTIYSRMNEEAVRGTEEAYGRVGFDTYKSLIGNWLMENNWEEYLKKLEEDNMKLPFDA